METNGRIYKGVDMIEHNLSEHIWPSLTPEQVEQIKAEIALHPPRAILSLPGDEVEIIELYQDRAIALLRQITEISPYSEGWCLFCRELQIDPHKRDCPYFLANQLVDETDRGIE